MASGNRLSWFVIIILSGLYLLFPSGLSTVDGWYSAASIRYCGEIFSPHHLLYNALGLVFCKVTTFAGIEVILSMKVMNALFAFLALLTVARILSLYKLNEKQVALLTGLSGISFSVLRYATENETYIVPLFFALISSLNYLKYLESRRVENLLYSGLWASIAILFHQTYIFWWLGLLLGFILEAGRKRVLVYLAVSVIVPVAYLIVILSSPGGFTPGKAIGFLSGDFINGARFELNSRGILLSIINLFRSFIQVHGYIFNMVKESRLLLIPGIISLVFVVFAFLKFPSKGTIILSRRFAVVHILILALQYSFAVLSNGNAEFMVMIPVLLFILFPFFASGYEKFLLRIFIGMTIWNVSYGLIPLHFKDQAPEQFMCNAAMSASEPVIIPSDEQLIKSMIYYQTGDTCVNNIYKSPAVLLIGRKDTTILNKVIFNALRNDKVVYTDCLGKKVMSRYTIMEGSVNEVFFRKFDAILKKSWKSITGTSSVYSIEGK